MPGDPAAGTQVRWIERTEDPPHALDALRPADRLRLARACDRRWREFATARLCAREALAALGRPGTHAGTGGRGEPTWPDGVVGSITHCTGLRAAAVADARSVAAVGIDAEPDLPLPPGVAPYVLRAGELAALARAQPIGVHADRLAFCVKEAVYKMCWPLTRSRAGFHDAAVVLGADGTFRARLLVPGPVVDGRRHGVVTGRWTAAGGVLRVLAVLPRGAVQPVMRPAANAAPWVVEPLVP